MKKDLLRGVIGFSVLLILYLLIAFLVPFSKTAVFWISLVFSVVSIAVAAVAFYIAFVKRPDAKSQFFGFPVAKIGAIYCVVQLALGVIGMSMSTILPWWGVVLVFAVIMGGAVLGLISTEAVAQQIREQDRQLKQDTVLMRQLCSVANQLADRCPQTEVKEFAEQLRYSDPVSCAALASVEQQLSQAVEALQAAVKAADAAAIRNACQEASAVLSERNRICKLEKQ